MLCRQGNEEEFIYQLQERYSNFSQFTLVFAYVCRAINIWTRKLRITGRLTRDEMLDATNRILKIVQEKHFDMEIRSLKNNQPVPKSSKLITLDPMIDKHGMLRVAGRIENAPLDLDQRHPIILPNHDPVVKMLIRECHSTNCHCGPSYLFHKLRQKYWIIGAKKTIQGILRECVACVKQNPTTIHQKMGVLPRERVELTKPFKRTGVDFFGPIRAYLTHGRGQKPRKVYGCVFICMCTKALHLEVVTDLSTEAFLGAFDRFVARRGPITDVYSDNGSNFRGAKRELEDIFRFVMRNADFIAAKVLKQHQITWHFIPPYAPHFGGLWEAGVRSVKTHLHRVTGDKTLSIDELHTLLVQIEAMLNNRPLYISGPEVNDVLTPAHFLVGTQWLAGPQLDFTNTKYNCLSHWQAVKKMVQLMWKRWYQEYVHTLQQRWKWRVDTANVKVGQIVLIKEDNPLLNRWRMGKIVELHPGTDGRVRLVTIKTLEGNIQRTIHKLCPLPIQDTCHDDLAATTSQ